MTVTELSQVSPAAAQLADVLRDLNEVVERHGVTGFALMFAPQGVTLPDGYVLVQKIDATGTITLVPTPIGECELDAVVQETQTFDLGDKAFITFAGRLGEGRACEVIAATGDAVVPGRAHRHGK